MEIILSIIVIGIAITGLSVGIILNNKPLKGSCGGQDGKVIIDGVEMTCPTCGGDNIKCENTESEPVIP